MNYLISISIALILLFNIQYLASYFFYPEVKLPLDSLDSKNTIFNTDSRYVFYNIHKLSENNNKKIIILGASNAQRGLRPSQLSYIFPGYEVHNLSIGGSDIHQISQLAQLILEVIPAHNRKNIIIILGVWYGNFIDKNRRWDEGQSALANEMIRYGLYKKNEQDLPVPVLKSSFMQIGHNLVRPFILFTKFYNIYIYNPFNSLKNLIREKLIGEYVVDITDDPDIHIFTKHEKDLAIKFLLNDIGMPMHLTMESYDKLFQTVKYISTSEVNLVLLDLPISKWNEENLPFDKIYQLNLSNYLPKMLLYKNVQYLSIRDLANDEHFYDYAHPRPKASILWAKSLSNKFLFE